MCFYLFMSFIYSLFIHLFSELILNSWIGKYLQFLIPVQSSSCYMKQRNQKCYNARRIWCKVLKRGMNKLWKHRRRVCELTRRTEEHSALLLNYAAVQTPPSTQGPREQVHLDFTDLFSWAPKSLQIVTEVMKLKDACFLEEKRWPT